MQAVLMSVSWNEWLTMPVDYSILPISSQLAITIWDISPTGGEWGKGHHVPFGGTTVSIFENDCTLKQGRQKCKVYRHRPADGLSTTTTPAIPAPARNGGQSSGDGEEDEVERLEKLLKKHEMGEIPRIDWLDQLAFRRVEQRGHLTTKSGKSASNGLNGIMAPSTAENPSNGDLVKDNNLKEGEGSDGHVNRSNDDNFTLFIDFPRFDFPVVFTDYEYPPPSFTSAARQTPTSSTVALKPPPTVQLAVAGGAEGDGDPRGGRIVKVYDPEVHARDNPAENLHRRLVRSHRTNLVDRDLKPNAKIRDELNVRLSSNV